MTNGNSGSSDRLDRIEAIVESNSRAIQATSAAIEATSANLDKLSSELQETKAIANSNSRAIQAMMEQQVTDRLKHEEAMAEMRDIMRRVVETQSGLTSDPADF